MIKGLAFLVTILTLTPLFLSSQTPHWLWAKGFGGDYVDKANALATDADGNVYMAGEFYSSSITLGSTTLYNTGLSDIYIVKLDSSGKVLWANSFQGSAGSENRTADLTVDSHGNVIITGYFESSSLYYNGYAVNNTSLTDLFVAKISPSSDLIWMKTAVGSGYDMSKCVCIDKDDNLFLAGSFDSYVLSMDDIVLDKKGNGNPCSNAFIFKLNENGEAVWGTNFGEDSDDGIIIRAINEKPDGNIVFGGYFTTPRLGIGQDTIFNLDTIPDCSGDIFIAEISPGFECSVVKQIAGTDHDYIYDMDIDKEGNIVFTGYFNSDPLIIGSDTLSYIPPNIDMFTALMSSTGDFLWARSMGDDPILADNINCVFDAKGNVIITGQYWTDTLIIENDTFVANMFPDLFLLKYNHEGEIEWCRGAGNEGFDNPYALTIDNEDNIYMAGSYSSSVFVIGNDSLINIGANDCFLAKFSENLIQDSLPDITFGIFPNPSNGFFTVNPGALFPQGYNLEVNNILGQRVFEMQADDQQPQELFLPLAAGVYCVTIYNQQTGISAKIVIR